MRTTHTILELIRARGPLRSVARQADAGKPDAWKSGTSGLEGGSRKRTLYGTSSAAYPTKCTCVLVDVPIIYGVRLMRMG